MEKKQRMFYFGTDGCAGHYPQPINSDLPNVKSDDWAHFDGAMLVWIRQYGTYSQGKLFGSEWSVYAVPWSVDDARGGCHTDFLWEGEHTKEEMEAYIKQNDFLRRQFRFKLEASMVNRGDIVHASDDSLIKNTSHWCRRRSLLFKFRKSLIRLQRFFIQSSEAD